MRLRTRVSESSTIPDRNRRGKKAALGALVAVPVIATSLLVAGFVMAPQAPELRPSTSPALIMPAPDVAGVGLEAALAQVGAVAETSRLAREEAARVAAEKRAAEEAERARIAAEKKAAEEAERARVAAEEKAAAEAERARIAAEKRAEEKAEERAAAEAAERARIAAEEEAADETARIAAEEAAEERDRESSSRAEGPVSRSSERASSGSSQGAGGVWAQLRKCESGGNYQINTGNGYYGAYQFSPGTWSSLGYEGLPHEADPATQDAAAADLQARSGWGQWPACSRKLGLR